MTQPATFDEWLSLGLKKGWAAMYCATHDDTPTTHDEDLEYQMWDDPPCLPALRIYLPENYQ